MLWFVAKVWAVMLFMIWTRATLVRIRYDHFMKLGWKFLIPVSLTWFVLVAVVRAYRAFSGGSTRGLLLVLAVIGCTSLPKRLWEKREQSLSPALSDGLRTVWVVVVLLVSMAFLVGDSYNPFLYFRF